MSQRNGVVTSTSQLRQHLLPNEWFLYLPRAYRRVWIPTWRGNYQPYLHSPLLSARPWLVRHATQPEWVWSASRSTCVVSGFNSSCETRWVEDQFWLRWDVNVASYPIMQSTGLPKVEVYDFMYSRLRHWSIAKNQNGWLRICIDDIYSNFIYNLMSSMT